LRELRFATYERRTGRSFVALRTERRPDHRGTVAAGLEFETAARKLARRRIGEDLTRFCTVGERSGAVDDLADRLGEVDLASPRGDADLAPLFGEEPPELEGARRLSA